MPWGRAVRGEGGSPLPARLPLRSSSPLLPALPAHRRAVRQLGPGPSPLTPGPPQPPAAGRGGSAVRAGAAGPSRGWGWAGGGGRRPPCAAPAGARRRCLSRPSRVGGCRRRCVRGTAAERRGGPSLAAPGGSAACQGAGACWLRRAPREGLLRRCCGFAWATRPLLPVTSGDEGRGGAEGFSPSPPRQKKKNPTQTNHPKPKKTKALSAQGSLLAQEQLALAGCPGLTSQKQRSPHQLPHRALAQPALVAQRIA